MIVLFLLTTGQYVMYDEVMKQAEEKQTQSTAFDDYVAQLHEDLDQIENEKKEKLFKEAERIENERIRKKKIKGLLRTFAIAFCVGCTLSLPVVAIRVLLSEPAGAEIAETIPDRVISQDIDADTMLTVCEKCEEAHITIDGYIYGWDATLADLEKHKWSLHSEEDGAYTLHHESGSRLFDFRLDQGEDQPFTYIRMKKDELHSMSAKMPFGIEKGYTRQMVEGIFDSEGIPFTSNEDGLLFSYSASDLEGSSHYVECSVFFGDDTRLTSMIMTIERDGVRQTVVLE